MPAVLCKGVSALGAKQGVILNGTIKGSAGHGGAGQKDHSFLAILTDANSSVTALTIDIEGCIDLDNVADDDCHWVQLVQHAFSAGELTAKFAKFDLFDSIARRLRVNVISQTGFGAGDSLEVIYQEGTI